MYNGSSPINDINNQMYSSLSQDFKSYNNIKKIPIKIIMNDDEEVPENNSVDTDETSLYNINKQIRVEENKAIGNIKCHIFLYKYISNFF